MGHVGKVGSVVLTKKKRPATCLGTSVAPARLADAYRSVQHRGPPGLNHVLVKPTRTGTSAGRDEMSNIISGFKVSLAVVVLTGLFMACVGPEGLAGPAGPQGPIEAGARSRDRRGFSAYGPAGEQGWRGEPGPAGQGPIGSTAENPGHPRTVLAVRRVSRRSWTSRTTRGTGIRRAGRLAGS